VDTICGLAVVRIYDFDFDSAEIGFNRRPLRIAEIEVV